MNGYFAFLGKETMENLRTKKLLVLGCVFLFFAISSPLLGRFMGEFLAMLMPADDELGQAMIAVMSDPTWTDSFAQFYNNMSQIGTIAVILVFMGTILREKRSGSIDLVFTKGLSPGAFVLSKFTVAAIVITIVNLAAILVCYFYTQVLFDEIGQISYVILGGLIFNIFLLLLLALTMFCSALAKSTATSAVLSLMVFFVIIFASALPTVGRYLPGTFGLQDALSITLGEIPQDLIIALVVAFAFIVVSLWGAIYLSATRQAN